jgi:hypothetical protein
MLAAMDAAIPNPIAPKFTVDKKLSGWLQGMKAMG